MTLLVGIQCKDGVVIAADRQNTGSGVGQPTTKIHVLRNEGRPNAGILFAASGDVGMGQQIKDGASSFFEGGDRCHEVSRLRNAIWENVQSPAFARAAIIRSSIPAYETPTVEVMSAVSFDKGMQAFAIMGDGSFSFLTQENPYFALGSGTPGASYFLRFIWSFLFPDNRNQFPALAEGIPAAYWAVETAINDFQSYAVGFGVDIFTLKQENEGAETKYVASRLDENEIRGHQDLIAALEEQMRAFIKNKGPGGISPPPKVPDPSKK